MMVLLLLNLKRYCRQEFRTLRNREIKEHLVKWSAYSIDDATWEREDQLVQDYPSFMSR